MPQATTLLTFLEKYVGLFWFWLVPLGIFLENTVVFGHIFPGITILLLAGFYANSGSVPLIPSLILALLGAILGDNFDYFLGRAQGLLVFKRVPFFRRYLENIDSQVEKYGGWIIFGGRFLGPLRGWVTLSAGVLKIPYKKFFVFEFPSALIWTLTYFAAGYFLGTQRETIERILDKIGLIFWVALIVLLFWYLWKRRKEIFEYISAFKKWIFQKELLK